jgi:hypothetical protein
MTRKDAERNEAIEKLREWLSPGDTVYTIVRHVARSGMSREIGVVLMKDGVDLHPNYSVAKALGERQGKNDGVIVGGCGMDMGFHLVYNLGATIFKDGFNCIGEGCGSSDHANRKTPPDGTCLDHVQRKTGVCTNLDCNTWRHTDGGYALRHRWL